MIWTFIVAERKQLSVLKDTTSKDLYLWAIQETYPGFNTGWLSSGLTFLTIGLKSGLLPPLKLTTTGAAFPSYSNHPCCMPHALCTPTAHTTSTLIFKNTIFSHRNWCDTMHRCQVTSLIHNDSGLVTRNDFFTGAHDKIPTPHPLESTNLHNWFWVLSSSPKTLRFIHHMPLLVHRLSVYAPLVKAYSQFFLTHNSLTHPHMTTVKTIPP
jgi:hypothetical protein